MTERALRRTIREKLKAVPGFFLATTGVALAGTPDIVGCVVTTRDDADGHIVRGQFVALEVKTPNGSTTPLQEHRLAQIRAAGGVARVVRSWSDVEAALAEARGDS